MVNRDLVGSCGIYCGACAIYCGQRDGGKAFDYAVKRWKVPADEVRCKGCQALSQMCHGSNCERKKCLDSKGLRFCYECKIYESGSCKKYNQLASNLLLFGEDLRRNLAMIKAGDIDAWLVDQEKRWSCPLCRSPIFRQATKCPKCNRKI